MRGLKHKNVAAELLAKLLKDEIKVRSKRNLVQSRVVLRDAEEDAQRLPQPGHRHAGGHRGTDQAGQGDATPPTKRGEDLGLTDDEIAFYDALEVNDSAVQVMGDDELKVIAAELVTQVRKSVTIDWTVRESARAKIRVMVKRILEEVRLPARPAGRGHEDGAGAGGAAVRRLGAA